MKVLQINQNYNIGSTGHIMKEINDVARARGYDGYMLCAYSHGGDQGLYVTEKLLMPVAVRKNILKHRLSGLSGYSSVFSTKKAIRWIETVNPDIIHLHNVHGNWINLRLLFDYIKGKNVPIIWTLHDCWSFTGRCSHFESFNCYQWRDGCRKCPSLDVYPTSYFFDFSRKMWRDKKRWLTGFRNLTIVTPSEWLANYVKQSYLASYKTVVINNGIDLTHFNITDNKSRYLSNEERKVVLGVASSWTQWKGLDDFIKLYSILEKSKYVIVLVGLNDKQYNSLPNGIVGIKKTQSVIELAELYSMASVFVNPTYQDNYPTVNLESIACGTPVITYNTGGSIESVPDKVGMIVEKGDIKGLASAIEKVCTSTSFDPLGCRKYAIEHFDKNKKYLEYIHLYNSVLQNNK